jgi:hypothetical protein
LFLGSWTMEDASYGLHGKTVHGQVTMVVINKHGQDGSDQDQPGKGTSSTSAARPDLNRVQNTEYKVQQALRGQILILDLIQLVIHTSVGPMFIYKETR